MSEEHKSEQTVADENKDAATQASEEKSGAQGVSDEFESALSEFDKGTESPSKTQQQERSQPQNVNANLVAEIRALRQESVDRANREAMAGLIKQVRGDFEPNEFDDDFVKAWIVAQASKDPRLDAAWDNRDKDPAKFQRVVKSLTGVFAERHAKFRNVDPNVSEDVAAVAHAVKGGAKPAPESKPPDFSKMSDQEFSQTVQKEYGFSV